MDNIEQKELFALSPEQQAPYWGEISNEFNSLAEKMMKSIIKTTLSII